MLRIETVEDIKKGLDALCLVDPRLVPVRKIAGAVPLRRTPPGFGTLASIVVSQQVSRASAGAIFSRMTARFAPLTPEAVLSAKEPDFRHVGLSRAKQRTLIAIAQRATTNQLNLDNLCEIDPSQAMAELTKINGIGPWTAEIYLLFAAGHPDIFPAGDIALQTAIKDAFLRADRPDKRETADIAGLWAPWRGVAARLFWAYYRRVTGRDAALNL